MKKTDIPVKELVGMIERGELRLPEMQRQYVWRASRVRDLLDSLYRGYPSGGILVWETDVEMPSRDLAVAQSANPFAGHKLLLDGQQRLTSLSAVIRGEQIKVRGRKKPIDILFNLEHPDTLEELIEVDDDEEGDAEESDASAIDDEDDDEEEDELMERLGRLTFVVAAKRLANVPYWVSVTDVFKSGGDGQFLQKAGVKDFNDPRYNKYVDRLKRLRSIRDYQYTMYVLERGLSYLEVAEIFVRVNSLGAKLRGSDLAIAQVTARWQNSLKEFEGFQRTCSDSGFDIDLGTLVRALVVFATGQCRFNTLANVPVERLKEGWKRAKNGLEFAINFLKANVGIEAPVLLTSPYFLILVAYLAERKNGGFSQREEARLRLWIMLANARAWYSQSSETLLDQDLNVARGENPELGLVERLRARYGRLHVEPVDLQGRNVRSGMFKTLFLVLREKGAKDWFSGLGISLKHQGKQSKLQFHHIHPKARLRESYRPREVNDLANFAFISGKTNQKIGAKDPREYFARVREDHGEDAFLLQCVPTAPELLTVDGYPQFLATRRKALAEEINLYLEAVAATADLQLRPGAGG